MENETLVEITVEQATAVLEANEYTVLPNRAVHNMLQVIESVGSLNARDFVKLTAYYSTASFREVFEFFSGWKSKSDYDNGYKYQITRPQ